MSRKNFFDTTVQYSEGNGPGVVFVEFALTKLGH